MTFQEFLIKYNGKFVEAGGSDNARNQCVDLVNQYLVDVYKKPKILWTNAIDFPKKLDDDYEWIPNTPTGVPQEGDVIVWNIGKYGHIGIFIEGDVNSFRSFGQNYPLGSNAHVQNHTYKNVVGWFRLNNQQDNHQAIIDKLRTERDYNWDLFQSEKADLEEAQETIKQYEEFRQQLSRRLATADQFPSILGSIEKLVGFEDKFNTIQRDYNKLKAERDMLDSDNNTLSDKVKALGIQLSTLQGRLDNMQGISQSAEKCKSALKKLKNKKSLKDYSKWELFLAIIKP